MLRRLFNKYFKENKEKEQAIPHIVEENEKYIAISANGLVFTFDKTDEEQMEKLKNMTVFCPDGKIYDLYPIKPTDNSLCRFFEEEEYYHSFATKKAMGAIEWNISILFAITWIFR